MNRFLLLLAIAGGTFAIILFVRRPDLWDQFMLWMVGLAGPLIRIILWIGRQLGNLFKRKASPEANTASVNEPI